MHDLLQDTDRIRQIAILNDAFRTSFLGGTVCITAGLHLLGDDVVKAALLAVREFAQFSDEDDPEHEHAFGALVIEGRNVVWTIDYFDPTMLHASDDPARLAITRRVLTVMLAEEY